MQSLWHEYHHFARRIGNAGGECRAFARQRLTLASQGHRDGERDDPGGEVVADNAVECGEQWRATRPLCAPRRPKAREEDIEAVADQRDHAMDAAVDDARNAGGPIPGRIHGHARDNADVMVHRLHHVDDAGHRGDRQAADAAQIGSVSGEDGAW